jgi:hypothetical protein
MAVKSSMKASVLFGHSLCPMISGSDKNYGIGFPKNVLFMHVGGTGVERQFLSIKFIERPLRIADTIAPSQSVGTNSIDGCS